MFVKIFSLAISERYQTGLFSGLTTSLTGSFESFGVLVHNEFKFLSVSGTVSLEVTNAPGTPKVVGLKLTGPVFFVSIWK